MSALLDALTAAPRRSALSTAIETAYDPRQAAYDRGTVDAMGSGSFGRSWMASGLADDAGSLAMESFKAAARGDTETAWMLEQQARNLQARTQATNPNAVNFTDFFDGKAGLGDTPAFLGNALGQTRSSLAPLAGSVGGAGLGAAIGSIVPGIGTAAGAWLGGALGGGLTGYNMNANETAGNILEDPVAMQRTPDERVNTVRMSGAIKGALDAAPGMGAMASVGKKIAETGAKQAVKSSAAKTIAKDFLGEAVTEGAQNVVDDLAVHHLNPDHEINWKEALNAGVAGGIGGGAMGGAHHMVNRYIEGDDAAEPAKGKQGFLSKAANYVGEKAGEWFGRGGNMIGRVQDRYEYNNDFVGNGDFDILTSHDQQKVNDPAYQKSKIDAADRYARGITERFRGIAAKNDELVDAAVAYEAKRQANPNDSYAAADLFGEIIKRVHKDGERTRKLNAMEAALGGDSKANAQTPVNNVGSATDLHVPMDEQKSFMEAWADGFKRAFPALSVDHRMVYGEANQVGRQMDEARTGALNALFNWAKTGFHTFGSEDGKLPSKIQREIVDVLGEDSDVAIKKLATEMEKMGWISPSFKAAGFKIAADLGAHHTDRGALEKSLNDRLSIFAENEKDKPGLLDREMFRQRRFTEQSDRLRELQKQHDELLKTRPASLTKKELDTRLEKANQLKSEIDRLKPLVVKHLESMRRRYGKDAKSVMGELRKFQGEDQTLGGKLKKESLTKGADEGIEDEHGEQDYGYTLDPNERDAADDKVYSEFDSKSDIQHFGYDGKAGANAIDLNSSVAGDHIARATTAIQDEHGYQHEPTQIGVVTAARNAAIRDQRRIDEAGARKVAKNQRKAHLVEATTQAEDSIIAKYSKKIKNAKNLSREELLQAIDKRFVMMEIEKNLDDDKTVIHPHELEQLRTDPDMRSIEQQAKDMKQTADQFLQDNPDAKEGAGTVANGTIHLEQQDAKHPFSLNIGTLLNRMGKAAQQEVTHKENLAAVRDKVLAAVSAILHAGGEKFTGRIGFQMKAGEAVQWLTDKDIDTRSLMHQPAEIKKLAARLPEQLIYAAAGKKNVISEGSIQEEESKVKLSNEKWVDPAATTLGEFMNFTHEDRESILNDLADKAERLLQAGNERKAEKLLEQVLRFEEAIFSETKDFMGDPSERPFGDLNTQSVMESGIENGEFRTTDENGDSVVPERIPTSAAELANSIVQGRKALNRNEAQKLANQMKDLLKSAIPAFTSKLKGMTNEQVLDLYANLVKVISADIEKVASATKRGWTNVHRTLDKVPGHTADQVRGKLAKLRDIVGAEVYRRRDQDEGFLAKWLAEQPNMVEKREQAGRDAIRTRDNLINQSVPNHTVEVRNWHARAADRRAAIEARQQKRLSKVLKAMADVNAGLTARRNEKQKLRDLREEFLALRALISDPQAENLQRINNKAIPTERGQLADMVLRSGELPAFLLTGDVNVLREIARGLNDAIRALHARQRLASLGRNSESLLGANDQEAKMYTKGMQQILHALGVSVDESERLTNGLWQDEQTRDDFENRINQLADKTSWSIWRLLGKGSTGNIGRVKVAIGLLKQFIDTTEKASIKKALKERLTLLESIRDHFEKQHAEHVDREDANPNKTLTEREKFVNALEDAWQTVKDKITEKDIDLMGQMSEEDARQYINDRVRDYENEEQTGVSDEDIASRMDGDTEYEGPGDEAYVHDAPETLPFDKEAINGLNEAHPELGARAPNELEHGMLNRAVRMMLDRAPGFERLVDMIGTFFVFSEKESAKGKGGPVGIGMNEALFSPAFLEALKTSYGVDNVSEIRDAVHRYIIAHEAGHRYDADRNLWQNPGFAVTNALEAEGVFAQEIFAAAATDHDMARTLAKSTFGKQKEGIAAKADPTRTMAKELVAQAVAYYFTRPNYMREAMPQTFAFFEKEFGNETRQEKDDHNTHPQKVTEGRSSVQHEQGRESSGAATGSSDVQHSQIAQLKEYLKLAVEKGKGLLAKNIEAVIDGRVKGNQIANTLAAAKKQLGELPETTKANRAEVAYVNRREFDDAIKRNDLQGARAALTAMKRSIAAGDFRSEWQRQDLMKSLHSAEVALDRLIERMTNNRELSNEERLTRIRHIMVLHNIAQSKLSSATTATAETLTDSQKAEIEAEVARTLGGRVETVFRDFLEEMGVRISGRWGNWNADRTKRLIEIAMNAHSPLGVARHEMIHELFKMLNEFGGNTVKEMLQKVATSPAILNQLKRELADHPNALAQLSDPEEAAAYMYQFWRAGKLSFGPNTQTFFGKVKALLAKLLGLVSQEYKEQAVALKIFETFRDGHLAENPDAAVQVLEKSVRESKEIIERGHALINALVENKALQKFLYSNWTVLRDTKNPYLIALGKLFHVAEGSKVGPVQAYLDAAKQVRNKFLGKLNNILRTHKLEKEDMALAMKYLIAHKPLNEIHHPEIKAFIKDYRKLLQEIENYARFDAKIQVYNSELKEWVPMGHIENYFHIKWDANGVVANSKKFGEMLKEHHMDELEKLVELAEKEREANKHKSDYAASHIPADQPITVDHIIDAIIKQMANTDGGGDVTESTARMGMTPYAAAVNKRTLSWINHEVFDEFIDKDFVAGATNYMSQMAKRGEYQRRFGPEGKVIRDEMDKAYAYRLLGSKEAVDRALAEVEQNKKDLIDTYGFKPSRESHHSAFLDQIEAMTDDELKADFKAREKRMDHPDVDGDLYELMEDENKMIERELAARQQGTNGNVPRFKRKTLRGVAESMLEGSPEQKTKKIKEAVSDMQMPAQAIMALEGTLGRDINKNLQALFQGITAYQNVRLLMFTLFTSFVDPAGVKVRGGTMKDAWKTFVYGVKSVKAAWLKEHGDLDELQQITMYMGISEAGMYMETMGETYGGAYQGHGLAKKINDWLFRVNGQEAWNRGVRQGATGAAIGFIKYHLQNPSKDQDRYLKDELGLDPAKKNEYFYDPSRDIPGAEPKPSFFKEGELDYDHPAVQAAVMKWVDGAVLNPNAAHRPIAASDAHHQLVYHLKQFTYSFHNVILRRATKEMEHGNVEPMIAMMATYIPMIVAADALRAMLLPGEPPEWTRSLTGMLMHGLDRSGIGGIPQMVMEGLPLIGGGHTAGLVGGPMGDQLAGILMTPFSDYHTASNELLGSLPGGTALRKLSPAPRDPGAGHGMSGGLLGLADDFAIIAAHAMKRS